MSQQRRRAPEPAIPVGGGADGVAPPEVFVPPSGVVGDPVEEDVLLDSENIVDDQPFYSDDSLPSIVEEEVEELSPEEDVMFSSLLTCGRRSKTVKILDHTVVVETLNGDDDLRIGLWVKDYVGSLGEQRAYQIGVAAAGIRTYDGKPFITTLYAEADESALFEEKVNKIKKMYPTVISRIYRAVMDAEKEFVELVTRLGKLDG